MALDAPFWVLDHLSNRQLLDSLGAALRRQRQALAQLIAQIGEVEERRLHLEAGHGSMFDYCVRRLGMSEDEACRRIDLARLSRGFPALFPLLAAGDISLSVALVLKPVLTPENHLELLAAARGNSIRQARELVAARFPSPDVASNIRKLPERQSRSWAEAAPIPAVNHPAPRLLQPLQEAKAAETCLPLPPMPPDARASAAPIARPVQSSRIEPLSAQRYKVQFTADVDLKEKLEQARDLLRHAHPNGDLGPIVSRALDLLIADLLKRRFGVGARRSVVARDGLACTWVGADGTRCASRAWLELDHRHPRGKGGASDSNNLRILCRAHNRFAAEKEYGRAVVERAVLARQRTARGSSPGDGAPC